MKKYKLKSHKGRIPSNISREGRAGDGCGIPMEEYNRLKNKENLMDSLLHELRRINGNLKDKLDSIDFEEDDRIIDIWAQSNLLSIRMQMYDFEANPQLFSQIGKYDIPIYRRIHKVKKCLNAELGKRNLDLNLVGTSHNQFEASDILEIAFYILIQNAIKYAVDDSVIEIIFNECGNQTTVTFRNKAELPRKDEVNDLVKRGYRGSNAEGKKEGSGIGLHTFYLICTYLGIRYNIIIGEEQSDENIGHFQVVMIFEDCSVN